MRPKTASDANMMNLPEPKTNGLSVGEYEQHLREQGYTRISFGAFANVFARKNGKEVVKVGNDVNSDGYLQFLRLVGLRSENPHLPYIRSLQIFDNDPGNPYSVPYYVVRMERLEEHAGMYSLALREFGIHDISELQEPLNLTARTREALEVKGILAQLFTTHVQDIKSSNVMFRGNTLVVTDPVCCPI